MKESSKKLSAGAARASAPAQCGDVASPDTHGDGFAAGEQIRLRAYQLYRDRGGRVGDDMGDWLQAEREYFELSPVARTSTCDARTALDLTLPAS